MCHWYIGPVEPFKRFKRHVFLWLEICNPITNLKKSKFNPFEVALSGKDLIRDTSTAPNPPVHPHPKRHLSSPKPLHLHPTPPGPSVVEYVQEPWLLVRVEMCRGNWSPPVGKTEKKNIWWELCLSINEDRWIQIISKRCIRKMKTDYNRRKLLDNGTCIFVSLSTDKTAMINFRL